MTTNLPAVQEKRNVLFSYKICGKGGGAEKNLIEVAEHVAKRHNVSFLLAGGYLDPRLAALGRIYLFPSRGRISLFPVDLVYMAYVIWRERVNLVHAHHRYPTFLGSLLRRFLGIRLLATVHNKFPDKGKISLWGDMAIAVSQGVADWLVHECGVAPQKVRTIHNGIKPPPRYPAEERERLRSGLGIPANAVVLCSVGRFTRQKDYPTLLRALAMTRRKGWFLLLIGDGEDRGMLVRMVETSGLSDRVRFLGLRQDVDLIMQASDIFVLSSAWEGFPYVLIEALANGLPIVCTDVGGNSEAALDNVTGFLAPPGDSPALAQRIDELAGNTALRETFSINCRKLFYEKFLDEAMLSRLDEVYQAMLTAD